MHELKSIQFHANFLPLLISPIICSPHSNLTGIFLAIPASKKCYNTAESTHFTFLGNSDIYVVTKQAQIRPCKADNQFTPYSHSNEVETASTMNE